MKKTLPMLMFFILSFSIVFQANIKIAWSEDAEGTQRDAEGTARDAEGTQRDAEGRQSSEVQTLTLPDPLNGATIEGLLERIVGWLRLIAAPIAAGMIIYGAYQMLFAAGDPEKFKVGRQTILYTVIGYAIIWIGWGIISIIEKFLATP